MKSRKDNFIDKSIISVTHFALTGFTQHLEEYLIKKRIKETLTIEHPLHSVAGKSESVFRVFSYGKLKAKGKANVSSSISLLNYIKAPILTINWVLKTGKNWDLYIGNNGLNTLAGIILKRLGKVNKVVFYSVDFVPHRFGNPLLDKIYHAIDKLSIVYSDEVWVLSPRMIEGRRKLLNISPKHDKKQVLFPEGVWLDRIKRKGFSQIEKHTAIFVGSLVERMGVQLAIMAIPEIIKIVPDFKLIIVGKGEYEHNLKKIVSDLNLEKYVNIKGFIKSHKEIENLIASCALGLAVYTKDDSGLTYYADPSKTKLYLGAGIPAVMTDTFYNAYDIQNAGAGIVVKDNAKDIARGILKIMTSDESLKKYKTNAISFAQKFDWPVLFKENLNRILSK